MNLRIITCVKNNQSEFPKLFKSTLNVKNLIIKN